MDVQKAPRTSDSIQLVGSQLNFDLSQAASLLWGKDVLSDLSVTSKDNAKLAVHSFVLVARSQWFREKLLEAPSSELGKNEQCHVIHLDYHSKTLKQLMQYIYTNTVSVQSGDLKELAEVADKLGVLELKNLCQHEDAGLNRQVTRENCLQLWASGSKMQSDVKINVEEVALNNFSSLRHSLSFKRLSLSSLLKYIGHPDLKFHSVTEKLSACLTWLEADPGSRLDSFPDLLDLLTLSKVESWYLDDLYHRNIIMNNPVILARLESVRNEDGTKVELDDTAVPTDTTNESSPNSPERCLVITGLIQAQSDQPSREVLAVRLSRGYEVVSLGEFKGVTYPSHDPEMTFHGCVGGDRVYVAGVGDDRQDIWCFDLNTRESSKCARFTAPRCNHGVTSGQDGTLYIVGGANPYTSEPCTAVERLDPSDLCMTTVGHLSYGGSQGFTCCLTKDGRNLLVCGGKDNNMYPVLQVFCLQTSTTTHIVSLSLSVVSKVRGAIHHSITSTRHTYGMLTADDNVVIFGPRETGLCSVDRLLSGQGVRYEKCFARTPNAPCATVLSDDHHSIQLVGGSNNYYGEQYCPVYTASVADLEKRLGGDWVPQEAPSWTLGECDIHVWGVANLAL